MSYYPIPIPMGELSVTSYLPTTCTLQNTWYKVAGVTTLLSDHQFSMPANNRLQYDGQPKLHLHAGVTLSFTVSAAAQLIEFAAFENGAEVTGSRIAMYHGTGTDQNSSAIHFMSHATTNDYFELYCRNTSSAAKDVTVTYMNLFAVALPT